MHRPFRLILALLYALVFVTPESGRGDDFFVAEFTTPTSGTMNGVAFTITGANNPSSFVTNVSGSDFSYAPASNMQSCFDYSVNSRVTITFARPVRNVLLYLVFWRGYTFDFDQPFEVRSGSNFIQEGNLVEVSGGFGNGIIEFAGPITSLTFGQSIAPMDASSQAIVLGQREDPSMIFTPTVSLTGPKKIRTTKRSVTIRGTARGYDPIARVEFKAPSEPFRLAKGTEAWSFRFRPDRRSSKLSVRATDQDGRAGANASLTVIRK